MGSIVYDFLTGSFLFDDNNISNEFRRFSEDELKKELRNYREFIFKNIRTIEDEIQSTNSDLKVLSGIKKIPYERLKQSAFYIEQYILYDPLFPFTHEESETSKAYREFHGADFSLDKEGLADTLKYLKGISYLVAKDYVKVLPISYLQEPKEEMPFFYSENLFSDVLPENILRFLQDNVKVESMKMNGNMLILENKLYPCRSIHVSFPKEGYEYANFYNLFETEITNYDEKNHVAHFVQRLPDTPPDIELFLNWVTQSINQAAKHVFDEIYMENMLAAKYDAAYMASNTFAFDLMQHEFVMKEEIKHDTANLLMNFKLPFIDQMDLNTVLDIRSNDGEAFKNFRINLDRHLKELRTIEDISLLKKKFENAIHEISEVQINEVNQKVNHLKQEATLDAAILLGGLLGAIQTGGLTLAASALAAAKGFKHWNDYYEKVKHHPAYFLWKAEKESKGS